MAVKITPAEDVAAGELADVKPPYVAVYLFSPRSLEQFALDVLTGRANPLWEYIAERVTTEAVDERAPGDTIVQRVVTPGPAPVDRSGLN